MVAVRVGIHEQDDLAVAQTVEVEFFTRARPDRGDEICQFGVGQNLVKRQPLRVQDFAAQRQNSLRLVVPPLLRGPAGRVAFDDK